MGGVPNMFNNRLKHLFSVLLLLLILFTQTVPAGATVKAFNYDTGTGLASTGSIECFPDKGKWNSRELLKIVPNADGDEYQPVDASTTFHVTWVMDFDKMEQQIATGLKYRVKLEVYGQFLDFDQTEVSVEFLLRKEDGLGYRTFHNFKKDVDGWNEIYYEGYVPAGAEGMLLRLQSHQYKGDATIYFRNISVALIDDTAPVVEGVLYNYRYDLKEKAAFKDYYGLDDKVTMDVVFSEPVFVNDTGYLAYARGLDAQGRTQLGDSIAKKYTYETGALSDVRNNNGRTLKDQFGSLRMQFTYKNADGSVKTGFADLIDRSLLKADPTTDQLKRLKFVYTVRAGDEFKAEDISDIQLVGGVITDNAFNRLSDTQRRISSQASGQASADDLAKKDIYHQYTQNFSVETSPPVLISINGNLPEGNVDGTLKICLKYSEPVYLIRPDISKSDIPEGYRRVNPNLVLNGEYIVRAEDKSLGNEAYYWGGDGTSQLEFIYNLYQDYEPMERSFDPLEVLDSIMMCNPPGQRYEFGRSYIADVAGNVAPLVLTEGSEGTGTAVKLSDSKYYAHEMVPPEISISARKTENGYSVKMDVTDEGSGLNYDEVKFGITGARYNYGFYNFIPGKEYSAKELTDLFNLKDISWGSYFINVSAQDNAGNYANKSIEVSRANFDVQPARIDNITDQGHGNYTISITDDGGGFNIASVRQKWVSSGTDPDLIEWAPVKSLIPMFRTRLKSIRRRLRISGNRPIYTLKQSTGRETAAFCPFPTPIKSRRKERSG